MFATRMRQASAGSVAYSAHAVKFDGTTNYLSLASDLTGSADGKEGAFSVWVNFKGGNGTAQTILSTQGGNFFIQKNTSNVWRVKGSTSAPATAVEVLGTTAKTDASGWHHVLMAWDLATPEAYLYIDDVDDEASSTENVADIDYTRVGWAVGANEAGTGKINADIADVWFDQSFIDITVEANRRKFIDAAGKPVDLLSNGSGPTGGSPLITLNDQVTAGWESNNGTGGGFTENGALADGDDSPSA